MARLGHLDVQKKQAEQAPAKVEGALKYCPQVDWKKAMDLALQSATPAAGAHRKQITVAFSAGQAPKAAVDYVRVPAEHLDVVRADLNGKPIEMDVSDLHESSTNAGLFPHGTSKNDYTAFSVAIVADGDSPRTRVAVVAKDDTTAARFLSRMVPTDKVRVRGTAYTAPESYQLSILIDSAGPAEG
jgi:hypothetical protein